MSALACEVSGCARPHKGRGLCEMHYTRQRRGVDLGGPEARKRDKRGTCLVAGCERSDKGPAGLCEMHYTRLRREGEAGTPHPRIAPRIPGRPTYEGAHRILRRTIGPAASQECVDCGRDAAEWSYAGSGSAELVDPRGYLYSTDPRDYAPRCRPCHRIYDNASRNLESYQ